jgi:hypothetical protein
VTTKGISALVLLALFVVSCDGTYKPNGGLQRVDYDMRGVWECVEEAPWPEDWSWNKEKGRLVLDYGSITITGPVAHLPDFTRDIALEAYTEETDGETGLLYIKDRGVWQSPISYRRWRSADKPVKFEMLTLTGGGLEEETLKKMGGSGS